MTSRAEKRWWDSVGGAARRPGPAGQPLPTRCHLRCRCRRCRPTASCHSQGSQTFPQDGTVPMLASRAAVQQTLGVSRGTKRGQHRPSRTALFCPAARLQLMPSAMCLPCSLLASSSHAACTVFCLYHYRLLACLQFILLLISCLAHSLMRVRIAESSPWFYTNCSHDCPSHPFPGPNCWCLN